MANGSTSLAEPDSHTRFACESLAPRDYGSTSCHQHRCTCTCSQARILNRTWQTYHSSYWVHALRSEQLASLASRASILHSLNPLPLEEVGRACETSPVWKYRTTKFTSCILVVVVWLYSWWVLTTTSHDTRWAEFKDSFPGHVQLSVACCTKVSFHALKGPRKQN